MSRILLLSLLVFFITTSMFFLTENPNIPIEKEIENLLERNTEEKINNIEKKETKNIVFSKKIITEDDFFDFSFKIFIPAIRVSTDLYLASSSGKKEIDYGPLYFYPMLISEKESFLLSPLGDFGISLIIGHRNLDFRNLHKLKKDDQIIITGDDQFEVIYLVSEIIEVNPEKVWDEIEKLSYKKEKSILVLMTCTPFPTDWERMLIIAEKN